MAGRAVRTSGPSRQLEALVLAIAIAAATLVWSSRPAFALDCGRWRWPIKTLSDPDAGEVDSVPVDSSIQHLLRLDPPGHLTADTPRIRGVEFTTYRVEADLVGAAIEPDHDVHLVIQQPGNQGKTMIVEFPYPRCDGAKDSAKRAAMRRARRALLDACGLIGKTFQKYAGHATITGVGFWDDPGASKRAAPSGIEIHPVLRFNGTCAKR